MNGIAMEIQALAVGRVKDGQVHAGSWEALALAEKLAGPDSTAALALPGASPELASRAAQSCGTTVVAMPVSGEVSPASPPMTRPLVDALASLVRESGCRVVTALADARGMDWAPALAVEWNAGYISGADALEQGEGESFFIRPVCGGRFSQKVPLCPPLVVTALPGSFPPGDPDPKKAARVLVRPVGPDRDGARFLGRTTARQGPGMPLEQAGVVVAAGRGVGGEENMEWIDKTAALFARGAVAGSRFACDMGWLPPRLQVGITGRTVAPGLYMACGISGAFQHLAGMRGSNLVVAVNTDPRAPIFTVSDYGVCEDLAAFLPLFVQACEEKDS